MVLEETNLKSIASGKAELDSLLGGGLPAGSLTLLEGPAETGKSILCEYFVHRSLISRIPVAFYTEDSNIKNVMQQMGSLDLDVTDYFLSDRLRLYTLAAESNGSELITLGLLLEHLEQLPAHYQLIVLDSISELSARVDEDALADFFLGCQQVCAVGHTVLATVRSEALDDDRRSRLQTVCNAHLRLTLEKIGDSNVSVLEILKLRNTLQDRDNTESLTVEPGDGLLVLPFTRKGA